jgi:hypothetical protein
MGNGPCLRATRTVSKRASCLAIGPDMALRIDFQAGPARWARPVQQARPRLVWRTDLPWLGCSKGALICFSLVYTWTGTWCQWLHQVLQVATQDDLYRPTSVNKRRTKPIIKIIQESIATVPWLSPFLSLLLIKGLESQATLFSISLSNYCVTKFTQNSVWITIFVASVLSADMYCVLTSRETPLSALRLKTEQKYFEPTAFVFYIMVPFSNMKNCQFQLVLQSFSTILYYLIAKM